MSKLVQVGLTPRQAKHAGWDTAHELTALGNASQTNALGLTAGINQVTTSTVTNNSVRLPVISECPSGVCVVFNDSGTSLNVYPASGEQINGAAANAPVTLASNENLWAFCAGDGSRWIATRN